MKETTKLTITDCDDFDFSDLDGQTDLQELHLGNISNLHRLGQIPELPNLKVLIIDSCANLVCLEGLAPPKLAHLHVKHCDALKDYAPLNEIASLENLTIHTKHPSLNGLRRANRPNLTVFVTVEDENGNYQKCFRSENDFERRFENSPEMKKFLGDEK